MIRFIIASIFIGLGLFILGVATLGIFRLDYVLNRIHVAAKCDTLGAMMVLAGLIIIDGLSFTSLKLLFILVFLWMSNPVASHLICKTEVLTNPDVTKECEVHHS